MHVQHVSLVLVLLLSCCRCWATCLLSSGVDTMNIWIAIHASWAGKLDGSSAPVEDECDLREGASQEKALQIILMICIKTDSKVTEKVHNL